MSSIWNTKSLCNRGLTYVKCVGKHLTAVCKIEKLHKANCGELHRGNYRGCIVAKELQKRETKFNMINKIIQKPPPHHTDLLS